MWGDFIIVSWSSVISYLILQSNLELQSHRSVLLVICHITSHSAALHSIRCSVIYFRLVYNARCKHYNSHKSPGYVTYRNQTVRVKERVWKVTRHYMCIYAFVNIKVLYSSHTQRFIHIYCGSSKTNVLMTDCKVWIIPILFTSKQLQMQLWMWLEYIVWHDVTL